MHYALALKLITADHATNSKTSFQLKDLFKGKSGLKWPTTIFTVQN